jgi:hypothetical protein
MQAVFYIFGVAVFKSYRRNCSGGGRRFFDYGR